MVHSISFTTNTLAMYYINQVTLWLLLFSVQAHTPFITKTAAAATHPPVSIMVTTDGKFCDAAATTHPPVSIMVTTDGKLFNAAANHPPVSIMVTTDGKFCNAAAATLLCLSWSQQTVSSVMQQQPPSCVYHGHNRR